MRRWQALVHGVALAVVHDHAAAEDVAQRAFERAWHHAGSYDPRRAPVATWLATITRRLAIDELRVRRPTPVDTASLLARAATGRSTEGHAEAATGADALRAALAHLPAAQARAVVLAGLAGLSAAEVARAEGIPLGTAKTRIRTGLGRLRDLLHEEAPWPS